MKKENITKLFISILLCQLAGLVSLVYTQKSISTWYPTLIKPAFMPASWLFAPVWIALFLLMGIALYLVWQKDKKMNINSAMVLFSIQLLLNVMWSVFFFGMQNPLYGFIDIMLLGLAILATTLSFWKISKTASYLLVPYLLWVIFAAVLNFYVLKLN
jgi:tryptophan-rich sensory protein